MVEPPHRLPEPIGPKYLDNRNVSVITVCLHITERSPGVEKKQLIKFRYYSQKASATVWAY